MQTLYRTTITIPQALYRKAKIRAAHSNKSVSRFISDILAKVVDVQNFQQKIPPLPLGKYSFSEKEGESYHRSSLYASHLRRKVSR